MESQITNEEIKSKIASNKHFWPDIWFWRNIQLCNCKIIINYTYNDYICRLKIIYLNYFKYIIYYYLNLILVEQLVILFKELVNIMVDKLDDKLESLLKI